MRCHYEVLEVERNASDDVIRKAYRKLALKWHPDKNPDRIKECTQHFALLQQAYEVLSDPHERAFYDRYRENILAGGVDGDLKDEGIDLFAFFTSSCYTGFGDDDKGFYTIYRRIFEQLASEDYEYIEEPADRCYPTFGNSQSGYEEVVSHFYGFWEGFSTVRSFAWLDEHDIRQAPNAKYIKLMDKENKKLRDVGKKERNEKIRELVQFVRKRDKRVIAYRQLLEERRKEQAIKTEEARKRQIRQRLQKLQDYKENDKHKENHLSDLRQIEEALDAEYGSNEDSEAEMLDPENDLYCIACEKSFSNLRTKHNHDKSKKHRENLALLKKHMLDDAAEFLFDSSKNGGVQLEEEPVVEQPQGGKKSKRQKKKERKQKAFDDLNEEDQVPAECSMSVADNDAEIKKLIEETDELDIVPKQKKANKKKKAGKSAKEDDQPTGPKEAVCDACKETFDSRTQLFAHLKETGHATLKSMAGPTKKGKKK
ncbi:hypothetical protein L596_000547 [Steinernema carpocapsae]|uniref:DnaJ homolog subfamily C member 21 n=1 Tax=Steinernema carpocapsae TaxID=34508 RepID=A0A4U8UIJ0_STECR|nr:hypothetical protein L596_000547 [Steinernema carpocapsae]